MTDNTLAAAAHALRTAAVLVIDLDEMGESVTQSKDWTDNLVELAYAADRVDALVCKAVAGPKPLTGAAAAKRAVELLREARDLLKEAGADRTVERVRAAISSANGAVRHAENREARPSIT